MENEVFVAMQTFLTGVVGAFKFFYVYCYFSKFKNSEYDTNKDYTDLDRKKLEQIIKENPEIFDKLKGIYT